jgi:signal transduction histidine kinase
METPLKDKLVKSGYPVYILSSLITILLLVNILLIYLNSKVIEENKNLQDEAEKIKVNTLDIIRTIHQVDMGMRGYALINSQVQLNVATDGFQRIDSIYDRLDKALSKQGFPKEHLQVMRDSTDWYFKIVKRMIRMVDEGRLNDFNTALKEDLGLYLFYAYANFARKVNTFENNIAGVALRRYEQALRNSYLLQVALFLFTVPALLYMVVLSRRSLKISEDLRKAEQRTIHILEQQKEELERQVNERTREILTQNEEISAQNEEIVSHNEQLILQQKQIELQKKELEIRNKQLQDAYKTIESKNQIISDKNKNLIDEVTRQTHDLRETNRELIEKNNRLEQFTYIISHNLRAPMARLLGLASLFDSAGDESEQKKIVTLLTRATLEFDRVFKDLSLILTIQKSNVEIYQEVNLENIYNKVAAMLASDIEATDAVIDTDFSKGSVIRGLPLYIESILYNLISNALKYREPSRKPLIRINSTRLNSSIQIVVRDNGLGIDVERFKDALFTLYRRFHFHVEGRGLGLYLVRTQVEALGGRIHLQSKLGEGSEFVIELPS